LEDQGLAVLAHSCFVEGLDASVVCAVEVKTVHGAHRLLSNIHFPELTTIAVIQLQNVAFGRHRGQGWLFPGQRSAVVVSTALLQLQDGGCWDWRGS